MEFYDVIHPDYKEFFRLRSTQGTRYARYLAFPAILKLDDSTVLIAYKNGVNHAEKGDGRVSLEQATLDIDTGKVTRVDEIYCEEGMIPQMGEYVRMPNGDILIYIDMQRALTKAERTGMQGMRSTDGGKTYAPCARVGVIDGVEYGYPFDSCVKNGRAYMLVMTFAYLQGSENRRQVHVISTADNGYTWRFEANITKILGIEFNESALISTDEGFMLATRGESARHEENTGSDGEASACIVRLDDNFNIIYSRDYRRTRADVSQFGRPRIYMHKGKLMLITRQHIHTSEGVRMALDMFAIDPVSLEILSRFRLNDPFMERQDGHYASLFLGKARGEDRLCVIDYLTCPTPANPSVYRKTDIIMLRFDPDGLRAQHREATGHDLT